MAKKKTLADVDKNSEKAGASKTKPARAKVKRPASATTAADASDASKGPNVRVMESPSTVFGAGAVVSGSLSATAPVGPLTDDLKAKFRSQTIPLQTDFWSLIDVADCGRRAVGLAPDQDGAPGTGMRLIDEKLAVLARPDSGIIVDAAGVGIVANAAKAIEITAEGIGVKCGGGVMLSGSGVLQLAGRIVRPTTLITTGNATTLQWRTIAYVSYYSSNAYLQFHITAKTSSARQRFELIASFDGTPRTNFATFSIMNSGLVGSRIIKSVRLGDDAGGYADGFLDIGFAVSAEVHLTIEYSPYLVAATIRDFSASGATHVAGTIEIDESQPVQKFTRI